MDHQEHIFHQPSDSQDQSDTIRSQQSHTLPANTTEMLPDPVAPGGRFRNPFGCMYNLILFSSILFIWGIIKLFNRFLPSFFTSFFGLHADQSALSGIHLSQSLSATFGIILMSVWIGAFVLLIWGYWKKRQWISAGLWGIWFDKSFFFTALLGLHISQSALSSIHLSQSLSTLLDALLAVIWIGVVALLTWGLYKEREWALWGARVVIFFIIIRLWVYSITWFLQNASHLGDKWLEATLLACVALVLSAFWLDGLARDIYRDFKKYTSEQ